MTEQAQPWTSETLARAAGVTGAYIRKLARDGKIEGAYKVGRDWLIPAEEGRAWLRQRSERWEKF